MLLLQCWATRQAAWHCLGRQWHLALAISCVKPAEGPDSYRAHVPSQRRESSAMAEAAAAVIILGVEFGAFQPRAASGTKPPTPVAAGNSSVAAQ